MTRSAAMPSESNRQNAHLTFKENLHQGRHGWLRLTPAYSVGLVTEILRSKTPPASVLDPFSGTGTTALCAAYMGFHGTGLEINPFLVWFSSVKSRIFQPAVVERTRELGNKIGIASVSSSSPKMSSPPIHNISRWWNDADLDYLQRLKACIREAASVGGDESDLLLVAFCRMVIKLSNAAFNHQSMSFKAIGNESPCLFDIRADRADLFCGELSSVLEAATKNPATAPRIVTGDARDASRYVGDKYDTLITSPPYPNRISYIRELRPYMYWLDYLTNGREAGELDWQAIGGTWGIATSRLMDWEASASIRIPKGLQNALTRISDAANKNGRLLANYIARYFEDISRHILSVGAVLNDHAEVHYVVGNSTFYGVLLPVEEIYRDILQHAGFHQVQVVRIRKRNSKAQLFEFDVAGTWK